ncbi:MAG: peptidoglycan-binding protein [Rhodospirillaceae bacterium]|nr:peptidoglycan-binding protein [Rhodospirillaceae bacterium]
MIGAALALFAGALALPAASHAATPAEDLPSTKDASPKTPNARWRSGKAVENIQRALSDMGLYLGPIDGHLSDETRAAIRIYQKDAGLTVNGKVTRKLWDLLNNTVKVRQLLRRLELARKSGRDVARQALLSHPATRDLVDIPNNERADPTRNAEKCFDQPTVRCLLREATESSKAVFRPELRDWALGEILVAEARAGLTEQAMQTVRRIRDPRLIMVALRDIAEAEAAAGSAEDAIAAADIIPEREKRADALAAIAEIQIRRKDTDAARNTTAKLLVELEKMLSPLKRIALRSRAAVIIAQAGDTDAAARQMTAAEYEARDKLDGIEQGMALGYVASALAKMSSPGKAMALLGDITSPSERTSVLVSTAEAQVRAGDAAAALATADSIEKVRFKAAVLGRIAQTQAERGEQGDAELTIQLALAAIEKIKSAYARSFAISRVALAMASLTDTAMRGDADKAPFTYAKAAETAGKIDDSRLRAQTLWAIAAVRKAANDTEGSLETEHEAEAATNAIVSRLSRVWMFGEIALSHARHGHQDAAEAAFKRGLEAARTLENAWGRSRAMARLATTLVEVAAPQPARIIGEPD